MSVSTSPCKVLSSDFGLGLTNGSEAAASRLWVLKSQKSIEVPQAGARPPFESQRAGRISIDGGGDDDDEGKLLTLLTFKRQPR